MNWLDGCLLGFNTRTGEHIVSNNAAVVSCRSISESGDRNSASKVVAGNDRGQPCTSADDGSNHKL